MFRQKIARKIPHLSSLPLLPNLNLTPRMYMNTRFFFLAMVLSQRFIICDCEPLSYTRYLFTSFYKVSISQIIFHTPTLPGLFQSWAVPGMCVYAISSLFGFSRHLGAYNSQDAYCVIRSQFGLFQSLGTTHETSNPSSSSSLLRNLWVRFVHQCNTSRPCIVHVSATT